jgi:hypothetical protein
MALASRHVLLALLVAASLSADAALATRVIGDPQSDLKSNFFLAIVFSQATAIGAWVALGSDSLARRLAIGICVVAALSALASQLHRSMDDVFFTASLFVVVLAAEAFVMFLTGRAAPPASNLKGEMTEATVSERPRPQFSLLAVLEIIAAMGLLFAVLKRSVTLMFAVIPSRGAVQPTAGEILGTQLLWGLLAIPATAFVTFAAWAIWGVRVTRAVVWMVGMFFVFEVCMVGVAGILMIPLPLIAYLLLASGYLATFRLCGYSLRWQPTPETPATDRTV